MMGPGNISLFLVSFTVALTGALAPGPLLAQVITESARKGAKTGPLMIAGHALAETLMLILLVGGLGRLMRTPLLLRSVSLAGAAVLFYFAIRILVELRQPIEGFKSARSGNAGLLVQGISLSIANPYWSAWWLTVGLGLVLSANAKGMPAVAVFFCGHILADLIWYSLVSLAVSRGRGFFSARAYRGIMGLCGLSLLGFAIWFAAGNRH